MRVADHPYIRDVPKIATYKEVEEVLKSRDFTGGKFENESLPFRGDTLIELDGDDHFARRRVEASLFAKAALDYYEQGVLRPSIDRCLNECAKERGPDGVVRADLVRLTRRMLLQIAAAVIGLDDVNTPERVSLLELYMYPLNEAVDVKWSTRNHNDVIREGLEAKQGFLRDFFAPSYARRTQLVKEARAGRIDNSQLPKDVTTLLLMHRSDDWDDDLLAREGILYLNGATLTTSSAITHGVKDLEDWFTHRPEERARVMETDFLQRAANETLRLHPNVTALVRRAVADTVLRSGRVVRAGERLALDLYTANRDKTVFGSDADDFNPNRTVDDTVRPYGLAFGSGRHVCVGRPLVTTISGKSQEEGETDRSMLQILKALYRFGVHLDHDSPPILAPTAEEVYLVLPIQLPGL